MQPIDLHVLRFASKVCQMQCEKRRAHIGGPEAAAQFSWRLCPLLVIDWLQFRHRRNREYQATAAEPELSSNPDALIPEAHYESHGANADSKPAVMASPTKTSRVLSSQFVVLIEDCIPFITLSSEPILASCTLNRDSILPVCSRNCAHTAFSSDSIRLTCDSNCDTKISWRASILVLGEFNSASKR